MPTIPSPHMLPACTCSDNAREGRSHQRRCPARREWERLQTIAGELLDLIDMEMPLNEDGGKECVEDLRAILS